MAPGLSEYIITALLAAGVASKQECSLPDHDLSTLKREFFENCTQIERLCIINSGVRSVEDGAFFDLTRIKEVNLAKNLLARLNANAFRPRNTLQKLIVSGNRLSSLVDFDVEHFPEMTVLDVSDNQIRSLPEELVERARSRNLTVKIDNNPANWISGVGGTFEDFCDEPTALPSIRTPPQGGAKGCRFWTLGSFFSGILLSNVFLLRKIYFVFFRRTKTLGTQFDSVENHGLAHLSLNRLNYL